MGSSPKQDPFGRGPFYKDARTILGTYKGDPTVDDINPALNSEP